MVLAQGISFEKEKEDSWNCQGGGIESFILHGLSFVFTASARSVHRAVTGPQSSDSLGILDPRIESA